MISTSGSESKCIFCKNLGADYTLNHTENDWYAKLKDISNNNGVNVVFEHIGNKTWNNSLKMLSIGGRIVTCGSTTGSNVKINLAHLFFKQHS